MEENAKKDREREEIFSRAVRAGKRTYFFDVKKTISGEYYLTITESKRRFNNDQGKFYYEKHKLFLYKEDFDKYVEGLTDVIGFIKTEQPPPAPEEEKEEIVPASEPADEPTDEPAEKNKHTDISFEDLDSDSDDK
ncbi:MAG: DUF3276 family protein [Bacteroidales bacterium]|nr:DUF3276 family protein [Bacteroidota bacterium]MBL6950571.1 DUF3276 family protein [Bacteroidales bacterium]